MDPNNSLHLLAKAEVDVTDYQSRIGSLIHAVVCSQFDIAQAVGAVARHTSKPGKVHLNAVNRIFRYLRGTSDHVLVYDGNVGSAEPTVYADSDWAGDCTDRKSISGYVSLLSGAAISWSSKKQTTVALSSTEAEFLASSLGSQEAIWLCYILDSINLTPTLPTPLLVDNQSAIHMIKNGNINECTKHIDIKYRFICDVNESGLIETSYIPTCDQHADILTKPLACQKFTYFVRANGLRPRSEVHAR